jgi:hypothetical protein
MARSKIIWNLLKAKIPNKNPSLITNARVLFRRFLKRWPFTFNRKRIGLNIWKTKNFFQN